jgi:hypothetical protein
MNLRFALCGFLAINGVAAFQPKAFGVTEKKRLLSTLDAPVWRTPMNVPQMVAGGAERAGGDEYYEGMF